MLLKLLTPLNSWINIPLKSGLFFWVGGLFAWFYQSVDWLAVHNVFIQNTSTDSLMKPEWQQFGLWLHKNVIPIPSHATLLLFILLFVMFIGKVIVNRMTFPALRFLEGYGWLWKPFRKVLINGSDNFYYKPREEEFHNLGDPRNFSPEKRKRYIELEYEQIYLLSIEDRLPTRLGNILRSYERRPEQKYGLNTFVCWPHLWLVMPANAQKELSAARQDLDDAIQIWLWSAFFVIWIIWTPWVVPVAMVLMFITYSWILQAAITYGKLLEAAFDLYRPLLYKTLRLTLPDDPVTEVKKGENLTKYLLRGIKEEISFSEDAQYQEDNGD